MKPFILLSNDNDFKTIFFWIFGRSPRNKRHLSDELLFDNNVRRYSTQVFQTRFIKFERQEQRQGARNWEFTRTAQRFYVRQYHI